MKKVPTLFLKSVIFLITVATLALCIFGLPSIASEAAEHFSKLVYLPAIIGAYAAAIAFFLALYEALKLLNYLDKNMAFSQESVNALRNIKYYTATMSIMLLFGLPLIYFVADADDAPGLIIIGLAFAGTPFVVATFAGILQKLFQNAVNLKSENDLTV